MKKKEQKIYVFGTRGFPNVQGGVEKHCEQLYIRLARLGCNITVFTRKPYTSHLKGVNEWQGIKFIPLWCPKLEGIETVFHSFLATIICLIHRPDIIHIHNIGPGLMVGILKFFRLKVIVTYHSINYHHEKWKKLPKLLLKIGEFLCVKLANKVIVLSQSTKTFLENRFSGKDFQIIPNGMEILERASKKAYIESIGLTPGKYILSVGRFVPEKGLHHLISVFSNLQTDWKLVIAGDADHETPYSRQLKSQAADNSNVMLTGFIQGEALNEIYSHAGLFVLPSYHEGFPIVLLEALSYGLSVIVSSIAPNIEIGLDENRYFAVGDEKALAQKLDDWIKKGPMPREEQAKQIEMITQKYNWNNIAEQTLRVYESVLVGKE